MPFHFLHKAVLGERKLKEVLKEAQTLFEAYVWGEPNMPSTIQDLLLSNVEDWHEVGSGGEPTFENSWVNYELGTATAAFYKDPWGIVHIKGKIKSGTIDDTAFTLPVGYRPNNRLDFSAASNNLFGIFLVLAAGDVYPLVGSNTWISINCSFRAA